MIDKYFNAFNTFQLEILQALYETFNMMLFAMIFSLLGGLLLGFTLFITRPKGLYQQKVIYFIVSGLINIVRSVPFILFIIVIIPINRFVIGTGFGVDASKLPLSLIGIALFARFTEQDLLDVNPHIYETSYALGASTKQYLTHFLMKEARPSLILSFTSMTISLLSYSTVMGIIGGGGLGYLAMNEGYQNFNYPLMWLIIVLMVLIVQAIQATGNLIAKIYDKR